MALINQLTSAILQILLLTAIPLLWYSVTHKKVTGFARWIGLCRPSHFPVLYIPLILVGSLAAVAAPYLWLYRTGSLTYSGFTVDAYRSGGWNLEAIAAVLVWAVVQTSLSEEIFFRGFLCKRLSHAFGLRAGCLLQALIFGAVHIPAVLGKGVLPVLTVVALTGGIGYALGWLSQEKADGSILCGWLIHASANLISTVIVFQCLL